MWTRSCRPQKRPTPLDRGDQWAIGAAAAGAAAGASAAPSFFSIAADSAAGFLAAFFLWCTTFFLAGAFTAASAAGAAAAAAGAAAAAAGAAAAASAAASTGAEKANVAAASAAVRAITFTGLILYFLVICSRARAGSPGAAHCKSTIPGVVNCRAISCCVQHAPTRFRCATGSGGGQNDATGTGVPRSGRQVRGSARVPRSLHQTASSGFARSERCASPHFPSVSHRENGGASLHGQGKSDCADFP